MVVPVFVCDKPRHYAILLAKKKSGTMGTMIFMVEELEKRKKKKDQKSCYVSIVK